MYTPTLIQRFLDWLIDRPRRRLDMTILWPSLLEQTEDDLDASKAAFFYHITRDPAWTNRFSRAELKAFVDVLTHHSRTCP